MKWKLLLLAVLIGTFLLLYVDEDPVERVVPRPGGIEVEEPHESLRETSPALRQAVPAPAEIDAPLPDEPVAIESDAQQREVEWPTFGVLEVRVVQDADTDDLSDSPVAGGAVRLALSKNVFRTGAPPRLDDEDVLFERPLDARGEVRFEGLDSGRWYVEARTPTGGIRGASVQLNGEEGRRLVLRFGTGRIHGVVSDPTTWMPIANVDLRVSVGQTPKGMFGYEGQRELAALGRLPSSRSAKTGTDGAFQFDELPAGTVSLWLDPSVYDPDTAAYEFIPRRFVEFELAAGENRRFDFPDAAGAIWTGRVRTAHGESVTGSESNRGKLDVRLRGPVSYRQVQHVEASGSFRLHLPAGVHDVFLFSPFNDEETRPLGEAGLELEAGTLTNRDLILPGTRLVGTVIDSRGERLRGSQQFPVGAHLEGQTHSLAWHSTFLREDGSFVLDGLGPGEWVVGAGRSGASTSLTVRESDLELPVIITLP